MSRSKLAVHRIRSEIPLSSVLYSYGYHVYEDGGEHEQQFSCDLHGDGNDNTPSARLYPDSNKFYCFACGRVRDSVTLVMEKDGLQFWDAIKKLENTYGLPPLPWSEDSNSNVKPTIENLFIQSRTQTPQQILKRISTLISNYYNDEYDGFDVARMWEAYDRVDWYLSQDDMDVEVGKQLAIKVLDFVKHYYK